MILGAVFILFASFLIWWILSRWQNLQQRAKLGLDGPPTNFLFGTTHHFGAWMKTNGKHLHRYQRDLQHKYGKVYGEYLGGHLQVFVHDVPMTKEILIKQFPNFINRMLAVMGEIEPMKDTLVANKGQEWKDLRSAISPTFATGKLKQLAFIMDAKLEIFMELMAEKAASGEDFDIAAHWQGLTLDVIGQAAFAVQVDCQRNHSDPFYVNCRRVFQEADFEASPLIMFAALATELHPYTSWLRPYSGMGRSERVLTDALRDVVTRRMADSGGFQGTDILQMLIHDRKAGGAKALSADDIVNNSYIFLLAGFETTSSALMFTSWLLAKNPQTQEKLAAEIAEALPSGGSDWEIVSRMAYLDAVFHEALRLFPPVTQFVARTCVQDTEVGGYAFTRGTEVVIPVWSIHQDPEYWPEPEEFRPERFYQNKDWEPAAWLPFGAGPRNCIGLRFAEMEYKKALVTLLAKFRIEFGPSSSPKMEPISRGALLAPPDNQIVVKLKPRH